ncbi:MAG: exosome complex protein Rrp42, partial [Candidatus Micrarchaeota archaeon]
VKSGHRLDKRAFDEFRKIEITDNFIENAEGRCLVKLGNTQVLVGVKLEVVEPYPDRPDEGTLMTSAELVPLSFAEFQPGRPDENSIEFARVVDRGIRESKIIDFKKLCIEPGKKVWSVMIDLHVLDYDGNLVDAGTLAVTRALYGTQMPKYENEQMTRDERTGPLPLAVKPVSCTFVKIGSQILVDPSTAEEKASDAEMTMTTNDDGDLCAAQKSGIGAFTKEEIDKMFETAVFKGKELRNML